MNMITSTVSLNCVQELINQPLSDKRQVDLLSEVNSLKYKVSATQREKDDLEDKLTWLQRKVDFLQEQLTERNGEVIKLHGSLTKRGLLPPLPSADTTYTTCTDKLDRLVADYSIPRTPENSETLERMRQKHAEIDRLKRTVDNLVAANEEKDSRIDELRNMVKTYQRVEDIILSASPREHSSPRSYSHEIEYYDNDTPFPIDNFTDEREVADLHRLELTGTHNSRMSTRSNSVPRHGSQGLTVTGKPPLPLNGRASPSPTGVPPGVPGVPGTYPTLQRSLPPHRSNSFGEHRSSARDLYSARDTAMLAARHSTPDNSVIMARGESPYNSMRRQASSPSSQLGSSVWDMQAQSQWTGSGSRDMQSQWTGSRDIQSHWNGSRDLQSQSQWNGFKDRDMQSQWTGSRDLQSQSPQSQWTSASSSPLRVVPDSPASTMMGPRSPRGMLDTPSAFFPPARSSNAPVDWSEFGGGRGMSPFDQSDVILPKESTPPISNSNTLSRKGPLRATLSRMFLRSKPSRWSTSAPVLAQSEEDAIKDELAQEYRALQNQTSKRPTQQNQQQQQAQQPKKSSGLGKLFGRLRRSNSQDLDVGTEPVDKTVSQFQRTPVRATLGARLAADGRMVEGSVPFAHWDSEQVASWLHGLGLSMYVGEAKRWVRNGQQLLNASVYDLVKELGIRSHLHRKKLQLALQAVATNAQGLIHRLDYHWVTRWLDDVGLPQYKDAFAEARVDGRMLHYLTAEDLLALHVTSVLHHLSIKSAIQVLRMNDFHPTCFKRRPLPDDGVLENCPQDVMLWTNHRVMEWLRSIDLAEYAANLRGSGVHGALMVLEPHFGAELLCTLLSIPASKTLLRRHLSTHFVTLIGNETQQNKRLAEAAPGYSPVTPNQRVKLKKFSAMFSRRDAVLEPDDLLCPLPKQQPTSAKRNGHNNTTNKEELFRNGPTSNV